MTCSDLVVTIYYNNLLLTFGLLVQVEKLNTWSYQYCLAGGGGGDMLHYYIQVLVQSMWMGMNMTQSIDEQRVYSTSGSPSRLYHDPMPQVTFIYEHLSLNKVPYLQSCLKWKLFAVKLKHSRMM